MRKKFFCYFRIVQDESKNMTPGQRKQVIVAALVFAVLVSLVCVDWTVFLRKDYRYVLKQGRLTWITEAAPWGFTSQNRDSIGFHYEVLKAYADSLKLELEVKVIPERKEQLKALRLGKGCLLATDVLHTAALKEHFCCLHPFYVAKIHLVQNVLADTLLTDASQLQGKRVFVPADDAYILRLQHLMEELAGDIEVLTSPKATEQNGLDSILTGDASYALCLDVHARYWKSNYPTLDFSVPVGMEQPCGWVVNKEATELALSLNEFLQNFMMTQDYRQIYRKYFSPSN